MKGIKMSCPNSVSMSYKMQFVNVSCLFYINIESTICNVKYWYGTIMAFGDSAKIHM